MKKAKKKYKPEKVDYINSDQLWPRKIAFKILSLDSREIMDSELNKLAQPLQKNVREYLNDWAAKYNGIANAKRLIK